MAGESWPPEGPGCDPGGDIISRANLHVGSVGLSGGASDLDNMTKYPALVETRTRFLFLDGAATIDDINDMPFTTLLSAQIAEW